MRGKDVRNGNGTLENGTRTRNPSISTGTEITVREHDPPPKQVDRFFDLDANKTRFILRAMYVLSLPLNFIITLVRVYFTRGSLAKI